MPEGATAAEPRPVGASAHPRARDVAWQHAWRRFVRNRLSTIGLGIVIVTVLGPGIAHAMIAISLVWWPGYARLVHGRAKALRGTMFVEAARALGAPWRRVILRHVLPNLLTIIVIKASMDMGMAILTAAALGFVGRGAQPPTPAWGEMISAGQPYLPTWWWLSVFPGTAIVVTVLGFNLLGDGLRDLLDPTTRSAVA